MESWAKWNELTVKVVKKSFEKERIKPFLEYCYSSRVKAKKNMTINQTLILKVPTEQISKGRGRIEEGIDFKRFLQ